jgi:serine/threonine protein phosphatase 1
MIRPETPSRVIAVGDIHGSAHALEALLAEIDPGPDDLILCLGDFIDQGRERRHVGGRIGVRAAVEW